MFDVFLILTPLLLLLIVALLRFIGCNQILGNTELTAANALSIAILPENPPSLGPGRSKQLSMLVNGAPPPDAETGAETWLPSQFFPNSHNGNFVAPYPWTTHSADVVPTYNGDLGMGSPTGTYKVALEHAQVGIKPSGTIQVKFGGSQTFEASTSNVAAPSGGTVNFQWSKNGTVVQVFSSNPAYNYSAPPPPFVATPPITISFKVDADPDGATGTNSAKILLVGNGATFVKTDTTTKGNWKGTYGAKGYALANTPNLISPPPFLTMFTPPTMLATFSDPTLPQDLENPGTGAPLQSVWYTATTLQIELPFTDYDVHEIAVYFAEWGGNPRVETISILDADTGATLSSQQLDDKVSSFVGGVYLVWQVTGHVILQVADNSSGANAVICGIFFNS
jgi:hypothetical protein